jgi:hypothetical protein
MHLHSARTHTRFTMLQSLATNVCASIENDFTYPSSVTYCTYHAHTIFNVEWYGHGTYNRSRISTSLPEGNILASHSPKCTDCWAKSKLSIINKLLVNKVILKPIWTYGIQLWGSASISSIEILKRFQRESPAHDNRRTMVRVGYGPPTRSSNHIS